MPLEIAITPAFGGSNGLSATVAAHGRIGDVARIASANFDLPRVSAGAVDLAVAGRLLYGVSSAIAARGTGRAQRRNGVVMA